MDDTGSLSVSDVPAPIPSVKDLELLASHYVNSGYFKDLRNVSQAIVKILKGRELGIGSFTAIDQIVIIQGHPTLNANLLAALLRKSKVYDYKIEELTNKVCAIRVLRHGKELEPIIRFTFEDAKQAFLTRNATYNAYPSNMLFARCISNAVRFHAPDIASGIYTPEELDLPGELISPVVEVPIPASTLLVSGTNEEVVTPVPQEVVENVF